MLVLQNFLVWFLLSVTLDIPLLLLLALLRLLSYLFSSIHNVHIFLLEKNVMLAVLLFVFRTVYEILLVGSNKFCLDFGLFR